MNNIEMLKKINKSESDIVELNEQLEHIETEIAGKTSFEYVDEQFSKIGNGSPKGVYSTLDELKLAFPTGNTNTYVITSDNCWYYWNGSTWAKGGAYQSSLTNYDGIKGNTDIINLTFSAYNCDNFSVSDTAITINNSAYGGVISNVLYTDNFTELYINMIAEVDSVINLCLFDSGNGYKGAIQLPFSSDGYTEIKKKITVDEIKAFGVTQFKIGFLSNSKSWKMNYLTVSKTNYNKETLQKELDKTNKKIDDLRILSDSKIINVTKNYSQVIEKNNKFNKDNLASYGGNMSFSYDNDVITLKNSELGGTHLGTFNLQGKDCLYLDCIIESRNAFDLGIMNTANGYKGAVRLSEGSSKKVICKIKISKTIFENYGLTGDFKLLLLTNSLNSKVHNLNISTENYNKDVLKDEINKLNENIKIIEENNKKINMNYLYVSKDYTPETEGFGEYYFDSIIDANNSIRYNREDNPYTIIVKNGTYSFNDIYSGNTSTDYQGIVTKDYVYYESENIKRPELCIIEWDGATGIENPTNEILVYKCPFHIAHEKATYSKLHTHIKGFTFNVRNCRYGLHVETQGRGLDVDWGIENCIINWYGRTASTNNTGQVPAIGMGMTPFESGRIKRCVINTLEEGNELGLQVHDNVMNSSYNYTPYLTDGAKLLIEDCKFNNKNIEANTGKYNSTDLSHIIHIKNVKGVNVAKAGTISGETKTNWKGIVECSEIVDNRF